jgi:hypothetical protein
VTEEAEAETAETGGVLDIGMGVGPILLIEETDAGVVDMLD